MLFDNKKKMIVLITGVSASGKTTLQDKLIDKGWKRPNNMTTRAPRGDYEYDEYIFESRDRALELIDKGIMLEFTQYGGDLYGIFNEKFDEDKNYSIIVDPVGRAMIMDKFNRLGIEYKTLYIDISEEEQINRLKKRYNNDKDKIDNRLLDRGWFHPTPSCTVVDGRTNINTLVSIIENL